MIPREIGWGQEAILLHAISIELEKLAGILATSSGGVIQTITGVGSIVVDNTDPANIIISSTAIASITAGKNMVVDITDPLNPIISTTADDIVVVPTYADLPAPGLQTGNFYWVSTATGSKWVPASLGGTFHDSGLYYSNGVTWEYLEVPYQATQAEVDAGTEPAKFVAPATLNGYYRWALKTEWKGNWVQQQYLINQQVLDNSFLAIANKTTTDRPSPQLIGQPGYIYTAGTIPTASVSAKQVIFGNRYQFNKDVLLEGWRVNVVAGNNYSIYLVENPLGTAIVSQVINYRAQRNGWIPLNVPKNIIKSGSTYDLVATVSQPASSPVLTTANYNYKKPTNSTAPLSGDITQAQNLTNTLRISKTDNNAIDRTALLTSLVIGDIIVGDGTRWAIQSKTDDGTYFSYVVSPATQLSSTGVKTFTFESVAATPITYPIAANYWGINPPVGIIAQGLLAVDATYFSIVPSTSAYGVDILIQEIIPSPDWDIQAVSEIGGSGNFADNIYAQADTGVLTFASPGLSINASTTTLDVGAVTGYIVDNESVPSSPTYKFINYPGATNVVIPTGLSYILVKSDNTLLIQSTLPTSTERKANIWLGKVSRPVSAITAISNEVDYVLSPQALVRDLFQVLGPYINDNVYPTPNGANMNVSILPGNILGDGINFVNSRTNPNKTLVPATSVANIVYRTINGGTTAAVTVIDSSNYNPSGGTISTVPGGPNVSTIQYFWGVPTTTGIGFVMQYGQFTYGNLDAAKAAVGKEVNVVFPSLPGNAILLAALAVRSGATNLSLTTDAQFYKADKLGQLSPAGGGISGGGGPTTIMFTFTVNSAMSTSDVDTNGYGQDGRNVVINTTLNVNITCNGNVTTSYAKHGPGTITFVQGAGRTLIVDGVTTTSAAFPGGPGSTAALWTVPGTTIDYIRISSL